MTPKMQLMARQLSRREQQAPAPVENHGVGSAIEQMIADEVERRVGEAMEHKPPPQVQRLLDQQSTPQPTYTSFEQIPPTPRAVTPRPLEATIQRDGAGLARSVTINGRRFLAQRDAAGQLVRMVSEDQASEVSYNGQPVPPAKANRGV
ncbi:MULTISPECIES: hypothetical protein [unclassified Pseudomonas]|uniref:hypothetical protein n=1 Tax=unclassified Pseudomonas TaxID=196821 RepID=UPI00224AB996|nr:MULTISPECIES: hypothetical protein [unclassified Pseudomonas]MCX2815997.1 hypothetical protein [Pseudomonas sp. DCB_E]MCX9144470.1 hypothetical protein [Pseudomonas sp. DCB_Q]